MNLRKATTHDSGFLLELKNDPVMRRFSVVTHDAIKKEDHEKWLSEHLDEIAIVMEGDDRIGMFRITKDDEVSINLHPKFRGKGYGSQVMKFCPEEVWAKIVEGNFPSMNLFISNGFKITSYKNGIYYLKN